MNDIFDIPTIESAISMEDSNTAEYGELMAPTTVKKNEKTKMPIQLYFRKTTKNKVLFIGEYMEVYIPTIDFSHKMASISGQIIKTYGMFEIHIWDKIPENNEAPKYITRYMYSSKITLIPTSIITKTVSICNGENTPCTVLQFRKNSIFIDNTDVKQDGATASTFINAIFEAFLPQTIKYDEFVKLFMECGKINGINFGVNATTIEVIFAAQCRYAKDLSLPYRVYLNKVASVKENASSKMLKLVKLVDLPHFTSTFSAFTFQNIDYAITSSALRHEQGKKEEESDIEKIMRY